MTTEIVERTKEDELKQLRQENLLLDASVTGAQLASEAATSLIRAIGERAPGTSGLYSKASFVRFDSIAEREMFRKRLTSAFQDEINRALSYIHVRPLT